MPPTPPSEPSAELLIGVALLWWGDRLAVGTRGPGGRFAGLAEFPGGKAEPGEDGAAAAARECREETGLPARLVGLRRVVRDRTGPGVLRLEFHDCVLDPAADGPPPLAPPFRWVTVAEAAGLPFPPANAAVLADVTAHPGPGGPAERAEPA